MLLNFATVLLSAVVHTALSADATSTRLGQNALEINGDGDRQSNYMRKMKKDKNQSGDSEDETVSLQDVEFIEEDGAQSFNQGLRTFALTGLDDDSSDWNHGSHAVSVTRPQDGIIKVNVPLEAQVGDTIFLFLSRTDGYLPLRLDGWKRGAECFKSSNRQDECLRAPHCVERDGPDAHCLKFRRNGQDAGTGMDLGTVLFYRKVTAGDPGCWTFEVSARPATTIWAVMTVITNVNEDRPIFRVQGQSCDKEWESAFPSVYGKENDVLLLSQCFDDTAEKDHFQRPVGTHLLGWTNSEDEAGFLYGKKLDATGQTGRHVTRGVGGPKCKDALLSVVVNRS